MITTKRFRAWECQIMSTVLNKRSAYILTITGHVMTIFFCKEHATQQAARFLTA